MVNQYTNTRERKMEWDVLYIKCTKCWVWKKEECFNREKWKMFWRKSSCKECKKEYNKRNKERINEYSRNYYKSNKADIIKRINENVIHHSNELWFNRHSFHDRAKHYVRNHNLKPHKCSVCWTTCNVEMHHPSYECYEKRSEVVFCCKACHINIHLWLLECPQPTNLLECKVAS